MSDWTGPQWLTCLSTLVDTYHEDVAGMDDETLQEESWRMEVEQPASEYNDRDFRLYRRVVRQEMHRRGFTTPTEDPNNPF